jgi:hypothetical protein
MPEDEQAAPEQLSGPITGTKFTYEQLREREVPEAILEGLEGAIQKSAPRKVGLVEANGQWYVYRSVGRREFKQVIQGATDRVVQQAQAAQTAGKEVNPATLNADSQAWMEEEVTIRCALFPNISRESLAADKVDAGVPKLLHDAVMMRSGFEQTSEPIAL